MPKCTVLYVVHPDFRLSVFSIQKEEGLYGAYCQVLWTIYFLLLSVIQPELLMLTVIDEITVKCYNTF